MNNKTTTMGNNRPEIHKDPPAATVPFRLPPLFAEVVIVGFIALYQSGVIYTASRISGGLQALSAIVAILVAAAYTVAPSQTGRARKLPSLLIAILLSYAAIASLQMILVNTSYDSIFWMRVRFVVFLISFVIILRNIERTWIIHTVARGAVCLACISTLIDLTVPAATHIFSTLHPEKLKYVGRASGFFSNPNVAASTIAFGAAFGALGLPMVLRITFYLITLAGILATFSRGGLLIWASGVAAVEVAYLTRHRRSPAAIATAPFALLALSSIVLLANSLVPSVRNTLSYFTSDRVLDRLTSIYDTSSQERSQLIEFGFLQFTKSPFFGHGVGYTYDWSLSVPVHNWYILLMVEHGVVGIIWLMLFLFALSKLGRPGGAIIIILILVKATFNHNVINEISDAVCIGLFAITAWHRFDYPLKLTFNSDSASTSRRKTSEDSF